MAFKRIKPDQLKVGMFINLNLSWFDHPFASSKFVIMDADTLSKVKRLTKLGGLEWDPEQSNIIEPKPMPSDMPIESGRLKRAIVRMTISQTRIPLRPKNKLSVPPLEKPARPSIRLRKRLLKLEIEFET